MFIFIIELFLRVLALYLLSVNTLGISNQILCAFKNFLAGDVYDNRTCQAIMDRKSILSYCNADNLDRKSVV